MRASAAQRVSAQRRSVKCRSALNWEESASHTISREFKEGMHQVHCQHEIAIVLMQKTCLGDDTTHNQSIDFTRHIFIDEQIERVIFNNPMGSVLVECVDFARIARMEYAIVFNDFVLEMKVT